MFPWQCAAVVIGGNVSNNGATVVVVSTVMDWHEEHEIDLKFKTKSGQCSKSSIIIYMLYTIHSTFVHPNPTYNGTNPHLTYKQ